MLARLVPRSQRVLVPWMILFARLAHPLLLTLDPTLTHPFSLLEGISISVFTSAATANKSEPQEATCPIVCFSKASDTVHHETATAVEPTPHSVTPTFPAAQPTWSSHPGLATQCLCWESERQGARSIITETMALRGRWSCLTPASKKLQ